MSEPALPIPEPPEDPEAIKWLRWLAHHFSREGKVIRGAPGAFTLAICAIGALIYIALEWHHAGETVNKDSTIQNLQSRIGILEGELKGASPQLAAQEARRAAARDQLQKMYIAAGPLMKVGALPPDLPNGGHSQAQILAFENQVVAERDEWEKSTADWLEKNLGPAAEARFLDISNMPIYGWYFEGIGVNDKLSRLMNRMANERKNLGVIIETSAYDR
jgi:uncharacterized small protein (DUF1192 family)